MNMIYVKVYVKDAEVLLAACDRELMGRTLKGDGIQLKVSKFYEGEIVSVDELKAMMATATMMNLVGNLVVNAARDAGHVDDSAVMTIDGVEHAQVVRM